MAQTRRKVITAVVLVAFANLVGLRSAFAIAGIADTGDALLAQMLVQGAQALQTTKSTLENIEQVKAFGEKAFNTAKDTYELAMHTAQAGEAAYAAGRSMREFSASRFGSAFTQDLQAAFPAIAYVRNEAENPLGLGTPNSSVTNALKYCLADAVNSQYRDVCTRLKGKSEQDKIQSMITLTYGIMPSTDRKDPRTQTELREQTFEDKINEALQRIEANRQLSEKAAARLADLREKCFESLPKGRSYGAFQQIADDYGRVKNDVNSFGNKPTNDTNTAQSAQVQQETEACRELHAQSGQIASEMARYDALMNAAVNELQAHKIAYEHSRQKRAAEQERAQLDAMTGDLSKTRLNLGSGNVAIKSDGYDMVNNAK